PDGPGGGNRDHLVAFDRGARLSQLALVHVRAKGACASVGENLMPKSIVMATAATADLVPAPIPASWILQGTPEATKKQLVRSDDLNSYIVAWDCTPGRFTWRYSEDETLVVISGEAVITNEKGEERRIAPGDMAFFPAGTSATWHVTSRIRKVAVVRHTMPLPVV